MTSSSRVGSVELDELPALIRCDVAKGDGTMLGEDILGPIDYLVVAFPTGSMTGAGFRLLAPRAPSHLAHSRTSRTVAPRALDRLGTISP